MDTNFQITNIRIQSNVISDFGVIINKCLEKAAV